MYSTFVTTTNADALDENTFLFGKAHDETRSMPMSHENAFIKDPCTNMVPILQLNKLVHGQYSESSTHSGDTHEALEANRSHISGKEERGGSISNGHEHGQEGSHAPSLFQHPHSIHNSLADAASQPRNQPKIDPRAISSGDRSSFRPIIGPTDTTVRLLPRNDSEITLNPMTSSRWSSGSSLSDVTSSTPEPAQLQETVSSESLSFSPSTTHSPPDIHRIATRNARTPKSVEFRANSSIPAAMSWEEFGRQSILAAESSRLNPFALHPDEHKLLRNHITHAQTTIYLNIRNAILRLWTRNPLINVTLAEAAGCAKHARFFNLAEVAYHWLSRQGYINFGCVGVTNTAAPILPAKAKARPPRTVVVIGAGMAGLGCARHLEGLFSQLGDKWTSSGEQSPKVIVLEARQRVGGRVYSHKLRNQDNSNLPAGHLCTAEMGAQIVTGFERGNPMNAIIRGQLGIPYHRLRDDTVLYDHDGTPVKKSQDMLVEKLYNDVLERASVYKGKPTSSQTGQGNRKLILIGRDSSDTAGPTIAELEDANVLYANTPPLSEDKASAGVVGVEKSAGRAYQHTAGLSPDIPAAEAAQTMGWLLKPGVSKTQDLDLDPITKSSQFPTLGETMDDGITQYQDLVDLQPQDLRLLNWHHANLEYANAASVNRLSLSGWDQDTGNEFEGEHTQIIGGYQQVPRGLWMLPEKLDVRFNAVVDSIHYNVEEPRTGKAVKIKCHNGEIFEADEVVLTAPLGVLKSGSINFEPPLPDWKQGVIDRMGFGLLNKVVLVYEEAFWEPNRDMFGLLNEAERQASLDVEDYSARRGRFWLFWNCIKTSGRPTLVALMAGDAAHYAEESSDDQIIKEVTDRLTKIFAPKQVPLPSESIVTRWSKDPFARGSYSFVDSKTLIGDYDVMAKPIGPLHFGGEATCGTHPATVHGAYLSGLRVASEVVDSMIGPLQVPTPLVEKKIKLEHPPTPVGLDQTQTLQFEAQPHSALSRGTRPFHADEDYEASIIGAILSSIGERPIKPGRSGVNPFLLYTKEHWYSCKKDCDEQRRAATGDPNAKASKTEIRTEVGLRWRTASADVKKPYLDATQKAKDNTAALTASYNERVAEWDREAARIRREYIQSNPPPNGVEDKMLNGWTAIELGGGKRARRI